MKGSSTIIVRTVLRYAKGASIIQEEESFKMKTIQIDDETWHRLRIFIASENSGKIHGKIGATATKAINEYIKQEEEYINALAKAAWAKRQKPK